MHPTKGYFFSTNGLQKRNSHSTFDAVLSILLMEKPFQLHEGPQLLKPQKKLVMRNLQFGIKATLIVLAFHAALFTINYIGWYNSLPW
jgi:hypothetical protein